MSLSSFREATTEVLEVTDGKWQFVAVLFISQTQIPTLQCSIVSSAQRQMKIDI